MDLEQDTLADLFTLMNHPPRLRRGNTRLLKPPSPAAGSSYTYPISSDYWERIVSVAFTLTTGAAAGQRQVMLAMADADGFVFNASPAIGDLGPSSSMVCYADLETAVPAPGAASTIGSGSVTDPAALAAIATLGTLQPGIWNVSGTVFLSGTVTAADGDNMSLDVAGASVLTLEYPGTANAPVAFSAQLDLGTAAAVTVNAIAAASGASAVYNAELTATPVSTAGAQASIPDIVLKSGYSLGITITGGHSGDQLSAIGILAERYPSNWADGSLEADKEARMRHALRWLADHAGE